MSVIDDYANAMNRYPADETEIEIVNVAKIGDPADTDMNTKEEWQFQVKLTNNGHVNMRNVSIKLVGLNGTRLREITDPPSDYANEIIVASLNPNGGEDSRTTKAFGLKAPANQQPAGTQLVEAHIEEWDSDTADHMATNHTKSFDEAGRLGIDYPSVFLTRRVFPR